MNEAHSACTKKGTIGRKGGSYVGGVSHSLKVFSSLHLVQRRHEVREKGATEWPT